ncbi:MAG: L,D-transpeptidase family protein [Fibrobacteria bacterium]
MTLRPGYTIRRQIHQVGVSFQVWRRNRETAIAFHDPLLYGGFPRIASVVRGAQIRRIRFAALSVAFIGLSVVTARFAIHHRAAAIASLGSITSATASSLASLSNHEPAALSNVPAAPALTTGPSASVASAPTAANLPSAFPSPAAPASGPNPEETPVVPAMAVVPPAEAKPVRLPENGFYLIACKRDRTLYAYRRVGSGWEKAVAYPMAIGRAFGDKLDAGDLRTPEGRFWIIGLFSGPSKGPIYGPLVFTLNYPRPGDEAEGKSGQGIWIHGTDMGKLPAYTHGCLSLANDDVVALSAFADIGTPLVILPDGVAPDPAKQMDVAGMEREYPSIVSAYGRKTQADTAAKAKALKDAGEFLAKEARSFPELSMQNLSAKDKQAIIDRLKHWRDDWSSRSIEKYGENYDPDFRDKEGRDRQSFLDRKAKIFETKSKIQMEISEPQIEPEGYSRVKVSFRQDYLAEGGNGSQRSSGPKTIRMESGPAGWLIITE